MNSAIAKIELDATVHSSANVADVPHVTFEDILKVCDADKVDAYIGEGNDLGSLVEDLVSLGTRYAAVMSANTLAGRYEAETKLAATIRILSARGRELRSGVINHFSDDCRERMAR